MLKINRLGLFLLLSLSTHAFSSDFPWAQSACYASDKDDNPIIYNGQKSTAIITQANSPVMMRCTWQNTNSDQADNPNLKMMLLLDSSVPYVKAECTFNSMITNHNKYTNIPIRWVYHGSYQQIDAILQIASINLNNYKLPPPTPLSKIQYSGQDDSSNLAPKASTETINFLIENTKTQADNNGFTPAQIVFFLNHDYGVIQNTDASVRKVDIEFNNNDNILCTFTPIDKPN